MKPFVLDTEFIPYQVRRADRAIYRTIAPARRQVRVMVGVRVTVTRYDVSTREKAHRQVKHLREEVSLYVWNLSILEGVYGYSHSV